VKRLLALTISCGLLVGSIAGCADDKSKDKGKKTTPPVTTTPDKKDDKPKEDKPADTKPGETTTKKD
jgi:hypothetical protein